MPAYELCAAGYESRKSVQRPATQDLAPISISEPKRQTVPGNRSEDCGGEKEPRFDIRRCRERADRENERRTGDHGTNDGDGFGESQKEARATGDLRM